MIEQIERDHHRHSPSCAGWRAHSACD
jgi:hypothetical protein